MTTDTVADVDEFRKLKPQRIQPIKAARAFRRLIRDKEDTRQVFEIMRALSGRSQTLGYRRMLTTMEGGRQAYEARELAHRLDDPAWLSAFAPGTVGAGYRVFREAMGFTADGLASVERQVIPFIDAPHPLLWYSRRLRDVHDIWHVLTGYQTDALGEACVVSFSYGQTGNLGFAAIGYGAAREIQREDRGIPARRAVIEAWRNGRRACWLPGLDYEALFAEPLEAARALMGIRPATVYASIPEPRRRGLKLRA